MPIELLPIITEPVRQRWETIPADIRQRLLYSLWCGESRYGTTITN